MAFINLPTEPLRKKVSSKHRNIYLFEATPGQGLAGSPGG